MYLRYRPVHIQDLPECRRCLRDYFAYDAETLADLLRLWRELLITGAGTAAVFEDTEAPPGERIVWFFINVFIPNEYAHYLKSDAPPLVGRHILEQWRVGRSPLLDLAAVRRANSPGGNGLNLLVLNSGSPQEVVQSDLFPMVAGKLVEYTPLGAGDTG